MIKRYNNIELGTLTTFGIRGIRAASLVNFDTSGDLPDIAADTALPQPLLPIGGGSNMLFTRDFKGTLLHNAMRHITPVSQPTAYKLQLVKVGGGVRLDYLCDWAAQNGLWGLENLSGIPGEVSGAAVQNVGAYGAEFGSNVHVVKLFDLKGKTFISIPGVECEYGYRHSVFKEPELKGRLVVVEVTLALSREPKPLLEYGNLASHFAPGIVPTPGQVRDAVITIRDSKLPRPEQTGSAGSFFKNPVIGADEYGRLAAANPSMPSYKLDDGRHKVPAAWLIDQCGLKGHSCGGASVWDKQPLVIVNTSGNATASDVLNLEQQIVSAVHRRFGITLTPEVEHI